MSSLLLTGIAGPLGVLGPGGLADVTSDKKTAPDVAVPVAVTGAGLSTTTLLIGGVALVLLLGMMRR